jgi:hypothetical protein
MTNPTIIGNATGSTMPNPAYYGFEWSECGRQLTFGEGEGPS